MWRPRSIPAVRTARRQEQTGMRPAPIRSVGECGSPLTRSARAPSAPVAPAAAKGPIAPPWPGTAAADNERPASTGSAGTGESVPVPGDRWKASSHLLIGGPAAGHYAPAGPRWFQYQERHPPEQRKCERPPAAAGGLPPETGELFLSDLGFFVFDVLADLRVVLL